MNTVSRDLSLAPGGVSRGEAEPSAAWVLVPREPTREMWEASGNAVNTIGHRFKLSGHHDRYSTAVWEAMLGAAPASPEGGSTGAPEEPKPTLNPTQGLEGET